MTNLTLDYIKNQLPVITNDKVELNGICDKHTYAEEIKGYYRYIPYMSARKNEDKYSDVDHYWNSKQPFIEALNLFLQDSKNVLDVGCGIGEMLSIMQIINSNTSYAGIEVNERYYNIAKKIYGNKIDFINIDAFDFTQYSKYDRIYTYCPVEDYELSIKFYSYIWKNLAVGTKWLEVYRDRALNELLEESFTNSFETRYLSERYCYFIKTA